VSTRLHVFHFAQDDDTSGFFPQLATWHDRSRYRMSFGTLKPIAPWLRELMTTQGVACFSGGAQRRAAYPAVALRLARLLRRERVDVVHTHLFEPSVVGLTAGTLAGVNGRVLTRHYSDYHTRIDKRWHVRLDQLSTRLSQVVIAVSRHTADHLVNLEGAPSAKVRTVLNGIDFQRVRLSCPDAPARLRQELGGAGAHLLLVPARLHPEKGHTHLFRALPDILRAADRPVILLLAGAGPFETAYRNEVSRLGCSDSVRFLGFRRDLPDLMAVADLVVLPSVAEAFGLVVAEALYLGTPVVATRVGGIPEIVDDGLDGVLVPPADSAALAAAVSSLLRDPERRHRLAAAGRAKVVARFRFEDMVRAYERIYEELPLGPRT
jgi:glycosyltransferase involved in cell wall biosynthesis